MLTYLLLDTVFDTTYWLGKKTCSLGYNAIYYTGNYLWYGWEEDEKEDVEQNDELLLKNIKDIIEENKLLKNRIKELEGLNSS